MNPAIEFAKKTKAKYGVTFTKNMGLQDILDNWERVPDEIKNKLGPIGTLISVYKTAQTLQQTARTTYVVAKEAYATVQSAIELASIPAGSTQVAPLALSVSTKGLEEVQNTIINKAPQTILDTLGEQV